MTMFIFLPEPHQHGLFLPIILILLSIYSLDTTYYTRKQEKKLPIDSEASKYIIHQNNVLIIQQMPYHDELHHEPFRVLYHELHLSLPF